MKTSDSDLQLDIPVYKHDFRRAALEVGSTVGAGSRLFSDITQRGRYYDIAERRYRGLPLRRFEEEAIRKVPEEFVDVFYFGDDAETPETLSLRSLQRAVDANIITPTDPHRYSVRLDIANRAIGNALHALNEV